MFQLEPDLRNVCHLLSVHLSSSNMWFDVNAEGLTWTKSFQKYVVFLCLFFPRPHLARIWFPSSLPPHAHFLWIVYIYGHLKHTLISRDGQAWNIEPGAVLSPHLSMGSFISSNAVPPTRSTNRKHRRENEVLMLGARSVSDQTQTGRCNGLDSKGDGS